MTPPRAWPAPQLLGLLAVLLLAGCVGPADSGVREIDADAVPYDLLDPEAPREAATLSTAPADAPEGRLLAEIYLVDPDGVLRPSPTAVEAGDTADLAGQVLERIEAGPSERERSLGLTGALGPGLGLRVEAVDQDVVEVEVSGDASLPSADQVPLAIGQVVLSLTALPGVEGVRLVSEGRPLPVPLPDGELTTDVVAEADYRDLTVP